MTATLQEFLAEEFDDVIEDYLDDIENLIDCKYTCLKYKNSTLCMHNLGSNDEIGEEFQHVM